MKTDYPSYSESDIYLFTERTREISRNPYQLFAAFVITSLAELIHSDPEDDQNPFIWGKTIPVDVFDRFYDSIVKDFIEAIENNLTIDINGKPYSIRNSKDITEERLREAFQFPKDEDGYAICRNGVKNIEEHPMTYEAQKQSLADDMRFLKRVIYLAYDDENDGWDKLTDMEVVVYVWAFYMAKAIRNDQRINDKYIANWYQDCKKYVDMPLKEIRSAWNEKFKIAEIADSICVFSAEKVREWNKNNGQESVVDEVDMEVADNYWYEQACKKDFA